MFVRLVPLLVCLLFLPLLAFLSIYAGWFVWKNVAVTWETPLFLIYGDGVQPYATTELANLVTLQPYHISLRLLVPASETTYNLGNFMASLTLATTRNKTLASVRRSAIVLPPKPSYLGSSPNFVEIIVPLLEYYTPAATSLLATVELGRRDRWRNLGNGQQRELSVVSASIRGMVVHRGVYGLASRFPFTFSLIAACLFFLVLLVPLAAFVLPAAFRPSLQTKPLWTEKSKSLLESPEPSSDEEKTRRRRRSKPRRRSNVKLEESDPPVALRRRSRVSERQSDSD